jgi:hypothetical protein
LATVQPVSERKVLRRFSAARADCFFFGPVGLLVGSFLGAFVGNRLQRREKP